LLIGIAVAIGFSLCLVVCPFLQRTPYLCAASLLGAAAYYWREFAGFLLVIGAAYAVARWLSSRAELAYRWHAACVALLALIAVFTRGRLQHWENILTSPGPMQLVFYSLDMWLTLRLVTLIWEVGSGAVTLSLSGFIIWACLPLTLGGPILRYSQLPSSLFIDRSLFKSRGWWLELGAGVFKLACGIGLVAAQQWVSEPARHAAFIGKAMNVFITGPISFYLTTAGYYQVMEVFGRPCGFKLPMSFSSPIGRENISAFWMNWNMSATFVFRDYLFYNRWGRQSYNVYFNTIVLFLLMGLWHAPNAYWILFGLLHGALFCVFLLWRKYHGSIGFLPLRGSPIARAGARVLTYVCVCACWYLPSKILQQFAVA
jgi:D-alanyl-lipoteichoic acid acyltransferase DltB (MBOAT superfamily)